MKTYTTSRNMYSTLSNDNTTANLTFGDQTINDGIRYLVNRFYVDQRTDASLTTIAATSTYKVPYNFKQMVDVFITVGSVRYTLVECPTREFFDRLNYISYSSDVPMYWFVFNGQLNIYPTPASNGNVITQVYKIRSTDLTQADYTTGTIALTNGSTTVTGSGTTFTAAMGTSNYWIQPAAPTGDGNWYQLESFTSTTVLTMVNKYQGATASGMSYTIGQVSILPEQYQDLPIYRALQIYFTTRVKDPTSAQLYNAMYEDGLKTMQAELEKSIDVRLRPAKVGTVNPNLFLYY